MHLVLSIPANYSTLNEVTSRTVYLADYSHDPVVAGGVENPVVEVGS